MHTHELNAEIGAFFDQFERHAVEPKTQMWLEWNVARAFQQLKFTKIISSRIKRGAHGTPVAGAVGDRPALLYDCVDFMLVVEVSIAAGYRQFARSGESVTRHTGKIRVAAPFGKPVYCLFIAPIIAPDTLSYFFGINAIHIAAHGGKAAVIPLALNQFKRLFAPVKPVAFTSPGQLQLFLDEILLANGIVDSEDAWHNCIAKNVAVWSQ